MSEPLDHQAISGRLERGEIDSAQYLEQLMRFVARTIGCSRAGLRIFIDTEAGRVLRCVAMFDAKRDRMVSATDLLHPAHGPYLERLQRDGCVGVGQARIDALTADTLREYLSSTGVVSLMDMCFSVNGMLFGTFTCEQTGVPVEWTQRQLQALRKIASRASLTLMHVVHGSGVDTAPGALWESSSPNRLVTMPMPLDNSPV